MAKKSRLREDAFAWVRDTSQREEKPKSPAKPQAVVAEKPKSAAKPKAVAAEKLRPLALAAGLRSILVRYENNVGWIAGTLEKKSGSNIDISWFGSATHDVRAFELAGELTSLDLFAIHERYRVDVSSPTPRLVRV